MPSHRPRSAALVGLLAAGLGGCAASGGPTTPDPAPEPVPASRGELAMPGIAAAFADRHEMQGQREGTEDLYAAASPDLAPPHSGIAEYHGSLRLWGYDDAANLYDAEGHLAVAVDFGDGRTAASAANFVGTYRRTDGTTIETRYDGTLTGRGWVDMVRGAPTLWSPLAGTLVAGDPSVPVADVRALTRLQLATDPWSGRQFGFGSASLSGTGLDWSTQAVVERISPPP